MDILLEQTNNGGDLVKLPKDLKVIHGFQNMIYLALFGGNKEASTPLRRLENEQAFDWWANSLCFPNDSSVQFNSETERILEKVAVNSQGRSRIEKAVIKDLEFMKSFAKVSVEVLIISTDKITIGIKVVRLDNLEQRSFVYIWDATIQELTEAESEILGSGTVVAKIFDSSFDFTFETVFPILFLGRLILELWIF